MGGLGIINVKKISSIEYETSKRYTESLVNKIANQNDTEKVMINHQPRNAVLTKSSYESQLLSKIRTKLNQQDLNANDIACSDGASACLSSLPLKDEDFSLTKRKFFDALYLRYGWSMNRLPSECVCHNKFSVDHALSCKLGGFVTLRLNELVNITANLVSSVCKDVCKEPVLQPSPGNDDDLRADISMRGFWQRQQRAFVDVRVFYPFARSYQNQSLKPLMKSMENIKKRKYNSRILESEHGSFTPLVFSSNGGMSQETKRFYSRLSELVAEKNNSTFSNTAAWIKRKLAFSLVRSAVICIHGSRSRKYCVGFDNIADADVKMNNSLIN
eukprot:gene3907-biopygen3345